MPDNIIKSDRFERIARGQAVVEALRPLDGEAKVLSVNATVSARVSEVFAGEARYSGRVRFDCLVLRSDGIVCESAVAEFSDKICSPDIVAGMSPTVTPQITNCEATISGGALKATAVVDTELCAVIRTDAGLTEFDDDIYADKRTVEYCTVVAEASETAYVADSIERSKASEVVLVTANAVLTDASCASGEIKLNGAVYFDVLTKQDGMLCSERRITPFSKTIGEPSADDACVACPRIAVTDCSGTLVDDGEARIDLSASLKIDVTAVRNVTSEAAVDVFCTENDINATVRSCEMCSIERMITVIDTVDGQITLEPDKLAADSVLCVANKFCMLSDVRTDDGRVYVEGLVGGDIVYYNAEKNETAAIAFRQPFSVPLQLRVDANDISLTCVVTDVAVKIRRESVFDIKAEIAFTANCKNRRTVDLVCAAERGEAKERPDATVIVHIARPGETLWQAAKAMNCPPERVSSQNDVAAPFKGGERLVNFCGK